MRKNSLLYIALGAAVTLASCDDFLDKMPDSRAEINSVDKVTSILVSAYPTITAAMMLEMSSDNAIDNGSKYSVESQDHEDAYLWKDITVTTNDAPKSFWDACYGAIAAANQALAAIEEMGNPANLQAQRGEALLCRAYGHFQLANVFCLAYNPETAEQDMGLPYSDAPETEVSPVYTRGTMAELYQKIYDDIEEGLPLINDEIYSVPKYHFNKKAAHAFAARFNLYYHKYDNVIKYANVVLGSTPDKMMKNWYELAMGSVSSSWANRVDLYISASDPSNLLLLPVTSSWGYWSGPYGLGLRYGHAMSLCTSETGRARGMWGTKDNLLPYKSMWGYEQKLAVSKMGGYFEYMDKVAGIGYRKIVITGFTADETLLCRAEAYALNNQLDLATADINIWLASHTVDGMQVERQDIVDFYSAVECMPLDNSTRTIKKELNPLGFTVTGGEQEEFIHCLLHLRRLETIHEGLRFQDIKRYGIEIAHNREGLENDVLRLDDPRRALQLPQDVISAGLDANPRK